MTLARPGMLTLNINVSIGKQKDHLSCIETLFKTQFLNWAWWHRPLIPAPGKQSSRPACSTSKFQDSQGCYIEKPCLKKTKQTTTVSAILPSYLWFYFLKFLLLAFNFYLKVLNRIFQK